MPNKRHGVGRDAFFAPREAEPFGGGGLDGDLAGRNAHDLGHARLHFRDVGIELGLLGADGGVEGLRCFAEVVVDAPFQVVGCHPLVGRAVAAEVIGQ